MSAALLPELAALGDVLARQPQWADDLCAVRARQLRILQVTISVWRLLQHRQPLQYALQTAGSMWPPVSRCVSGRQLSVTCKCTQCMARTCCLSVLLGMT